MSKHILMTGGTGFIGTRLCELLLAKGWQVTLFTRDPARAAERWGQKIATIRRLDEIKSLPTVDAVINLAGEPIMGGRWSAQRKHQISDSRIQVTRHLVSQLAQLPTQPAVMISGSAIGFYGNRDDDILEEDAAVGEGFSASLCRDWEKAAQPITFKKTRLCIVRIGVVLDRKGGALRKMLPAFRLGIGGRLGNGEQWMSWIHRDDVCALLLFLLEHPECQGIFNATAPDPVTNTVFTQALAERIRRPAILPMPALVLKLLFGEAAELLLNSQRVVPSRALEAGFTFQHSTLEDCLANCLPKR